MSRITSRLPIIPGSFEDIHEGFCLRKTMSKSGFYRMPEEVRDKLVTVLGPRTRRITPAAEAAFDTAHAKPDIHGTKIARQTKGQASG